MGDFKDEPPSTELSVWALKARRREQTEETSVKLCWPHRKETVTEVALLHPPVLLSFGRNNVPASLHCYPSPPMIFFNFFFTAVVWTDAAPPPVAPPSPESSPEARDNEATLSDSTGEGPGPDGSSRPETSNDAMYITSCRLLFHFIYEWIT